MEISVIVPTYNRAGLIGETLDAIFAQTLPPDEVIVVDDGSTDETVSVLSEFGARLMVISIPNSGDLAARNVGLQAAHGRLVAFCDSDDLWEPDFLEIMAEQWKAEPGLTACYANFRILCDGHLSQRTKFDDAPAGFFTGLRPIGPDALAADNSIVERLIRFQPCFPSCLMVARSTFLALGGWDEGVSRMVGGDFATALRLADAPPIALVTRPLGAVRKHSANFSGDTEAMNLGDANVLEHVLRTRPGLEPLRPAIARSIAERRRAALDSAFVRRDFARVRSIYKLLPPGERPSKQRIKFAIATGPARALAFLMKPDLGKAKSLPDRAVR